MCTGIPLSAISKLLLRRRRQDDDGQRASSHNLSSSSGHSPLLSSPQAAHADLLAKLKIASRRAADRLAILAMPTRQQLI